MRDDVQEGALLPKAALGVSKAFLGLSIALAFLSGAFADVPYGSLIRKVAQIGLGLGMALIMADRAWGARRVLQNPIFADREQRERSGMQRDSLGLWPDDLLMLNLIMSCGFVAIGFLMIILGACALVSSGW